MAKDKYVVLPKKYAPVTPVQKRLLDDLILQAERRGKELATGNGFSILPYNLILQDSREQLEKYLQKQNRRIATLEAEVKYRRERENRPPTAVHPGML